ncbi:MAG: translation initiation factor [Akkermansiaceae bacterium]|nr:translation initiation factor [Akkermansiaceae bacterium]
MTRVNDRIRAPKVRVVLFNGDQMGVMSAREALEKAKAIGLDLVEIAPNADPPVCRIVDYGKYKYEQSKLKKQKSKSATRMKEVKFRVGTGQHDYNIKMGRAETFLDGGHKVRMVLQFRGRENAHKELGFVMMTRIIEDLKTMAHVDQEPRLNGRAVGMTLSPLPAHQRKRKFHLFHGELLEEDDFEEDEEGEELSEEELVAGDSADDAASDISNATSEETEAGEEESEEPEPEPEPAPAPAPAAKATKAAKASKS